MNPTDVTRPFQDTIAPKKHTKSDFLKKSEFFSRLAAIPESDRALCLERAAHYADLAEKASA